MKNKYKKLNRDAFTLVELIVVLVIMSIIILIGTSIIFNRVHDAKISLFKISVQDIIDIAEKHASIEIFEKGKDNVIFSNISNEQGLTIDKYSDYNYKIKLFSKNGVLHGYYAIDNNDTFSTYGEIPIDEIIINESFVSASKVFFTDFGITFFENLDTNFFTNICVENKSFLEKKGFITYEDFYAIGDGKTNDAYAIYYAHNCANKLNVPIITNKKTYYISSTPKIGDKELSIEIKTNVNWNNSTIIIDDTATLRKTEVFTVPSTRYLVMSRDILKQNNIKSLKYNSESKNFSEILKPIESNIKKNYDYYIGLDSTDEIKRYSGSGTLMASSYKVDYFKVNSSGIINDSNNILYEYYYKSDSDTNIKNYGQIKVFEIPDEQLLLQNINFITKSSDYLKCFSEIGNSSSCSVIGGLKVNRPNVKIDNLNHYIIDGGKPMYYPYGFLTIQATSDIEITNSNFRTHLYKNSDGVKSVDGTNDIGMAYSSNITSDNIGYTCNEDETAQECYKNNMLDNEYHRGITGTSDIKNWIIKNSKLNRIDSHFSLLNLDVSSSIIGSFSINVVGSGNLNLKNSSIDQSNYIINLRHDYGSTWKGNINIDNVYFNVSPTDNGPRILFYNISSTEAFTYNQYVPGISASNIFINNKSNTAIPIIFVQNGAKSNLDTINTAKPTLFGNMTFKNIWSTTPELLNIRYPFLGNVKETYCYPVSGGQKCNSIWGVDRANIDYKIYLDTSSLKTKTFTTYFKDKYCIGNSCEYSGKNAVEIVTSNVGTPYCKVEVEETPENDWYNQNTLNVRLIYPEKYEIVDYGLGYNTKSYIKTDNLKVSDKGVYNIYGYIKDSNNNVYNCIKLVKKN